MSCHYSKCIYHFQNKSETIPLRGRFGVHSLRNSYPLHADLHERNIYKLFYLYYALFLIGNDFGRRFSKNCLYITKNNTYNTVDYCICLFFLVITFLNCLKYSAVNVEGNALPIEAADSAVLWIYTLMTYVDHIDTMPKVYICLPWHFTH